MRFVACLVIVAAIAGACALPDREEFASGTVDAGPSSGDSGGAIGDGGPDSADGNTPIDAGGDADAGFCPRTAVYCNDFSSGTPNDIGKTAISDGASLQIVNGVLESKLPLLPQEGSFEAGAVYELPISASKVNVEADLVVSEATWNGGNLIVLGVYYNGEPQSHAYELYIDPTGSSITTSENAMLIYDTATQSLPRGKSVHVRMETDFTPHKGTIAVYYDGALVISHNGPIDLSANTVSSFRVVIGMTRSNHPTPEITTTYDNFVVTLP